MSLLTYNDIGGLDCDTSGDPASIYFVKLGSLYVGQTSSPIVEWDVPKGSLCLCGSDFYVKSGDEADSWVKMVREGTAAILDSVTLTETVDPEEDFALYIADSGDGRRALYINLPVRGAVELALDDAEA